jgi:TonB family protein
VHLLLLVMFFVGSAFLSTREKLDNAPILDFVSSDMMPVDGNVSGGGGPVAHPPSTQPQPIQQPVEPPVPPPPVQQPVVPPRPQPKSEVVKAPAPEPPKIIKPSPDSIEVPKEPKHKIVVNTQLVTSNDKAAQDARDAQHNADKAAKRAADAQRKLAAAFGKATHELKSGMSSGTDIKFNPGFGGSGPAYASWLSIIKTIYYNDWKERLTDGLTDDAAVAEATVVIARDGTVISAQITQSSGNVAVDRSIQTTLDHVRFTSRFPETSKEEQTTLVLVFSVKVLKQLIG